MLYSLDTEFMEDGVSIFLLSIGVVAADGRTWYRQVVDADLTKANAFVLKHVLPALSDCSSGLGKDQHWDKMFSSGSRWECHHDGCPWAWPGTIRQELRVFVGEDPTFIGYYCAYDWVAICQLYGSMLGLPTTWPLYCRDLRQWLDDRAYTSIRQPDDMPHHALSDALWIMDTFQRYEH